VSGNSNKFRMGWLTLGRCAAAGVHALHLTTVVAERDLVSCRRLVFYRSPSSSLKPSLLKSFHSSHVHLFLLNALLCFPPWARASHERWRASLRQARLATPCVYACSLHLQRYKRELEASVAFGAHLSCLCTHSPPLRSPSFLSPVLFCLPLPGPARELEASAAFSGRLFCRSLLRPTSMSSGALAIRAWENHLSVSVPANSTCSGTTGRR
jgi:hypothetical protein